MEQKIDHVLAEAVKVLAGDSGRGLMTHTVEKDVALIMAPHTLNDAPNWKNFRGQLRSAVPGPMADYKQKWAAAKARVL